MTTYQQKRKDGLTEAEFLAQSRTWNDALPGQPPAPVFDPSGLVPYPCAHGIPVKPKRFPYTKFKPWLDADGNEKPPFAGKSWGRSKYLQIVAFGRRSDAPFADAKCVVCITGGAPDDFYTAADGSSLR